MTKENRHFFQEMPFYGVNLAESSYEVGNNLNCLPTKKQLNRLTSLYDLDIFSLNASDNNSAFDPSQLVRCKYYSPHNFDKLKNQPAINNSKFSILHNNVRSLKKNIENFQTHLLNELDYTFSVIGITETRINQVEISDFNPILYQIIILKACRRLYPLGALVCTLTKL